MRRIFADANTKKFNVKGVTGTRGLIYLEKCKASFTWGQTRIKSANVIQIWRPPLIEIKSDRPKMSVLKYCL